MTKKIAFLFPGQGAQAVGMGKDVAEISTVAKNVYETADKVLGKSISTLCFEGPEDSLKQTVNTQPCIVTTSIALLEALKEELNITPDYTAGHSLGEYCAMYTAGVMSLEDTLKSIQKRADLMSQTKGGSMAAVLNATDDQIKAGLEAGSKIGYVDVANYNSPVQVVITGDDNAVKAASENMIANGVRRVVPLAVSGAFHSKFMENASREFSQYVSSVELNNASIPVVTNVDAQMTTNSEEFREKMPKQICSSVHWTQTIENMIKNGVDTFIEIGPGKVLAGLNRKISSDITTYNVFDKASLDTTVAALKETLAGV